MTIAPAWTFIPFGWKFRKQARAATAKPFTPAASLGRPGAWISPGEMTLVIPPWT
jgi:hypothetical protein